MGTLADWAVTVRHKLFNFKTYNNMVYMLISFPLVYLTYLKR